jgi:hypothetical protein
MSSPTILSTSPTITNNNHNNNKPTTTSPRILTHKEISPSSSSQLLQQLQIQEQELNQKKKEAISILTKQSLRDADRAMESLRRALPELDVSSKTAAELRASIKKTMDRADVISVKVRELDVARSRAVLALEHVRRRLELRNALQGVANALREHDLEQAAEYVRRYDLARDPETMPEADEMRDYRNELQRAVLTQQQTQFSSTSSNSNNSSIVSEQDEMIAALKRASVMIKVGQLDIALEKYSGFLIAVLKNKLQSLMDNPNTRGLELDFTEVLKTILNKSAAMIEAHSPSSRNVEILSGDSLRISRELVIAIHNECDKLCVFVLDTFMTKKRLHERSSMSTTPNTDLTELSTLLVSLCFLMQHVETYDRFVHARYMEWFLDNNNDKQTTPLPPSEYRRTLQELAGVYTVLENAWMTESMNRAARMEAINPYVPSSVAMMNVIVGGNSNNNLHVPNLSTSSVVEDFYYVARRAAKRALSTGSADAACGCVNVLAGSLDDALAAVFDNMTASSTTSTTVATSLIGVVADTTTSLTSSNNSNNNNRILLTINSLEQAADFSRQLHQYLLSMAKETLDSDIVIHKFQSCAENLLDLASKIDHVRTERLDKIITNTFHRLAWDSISYELDDVTFERRMNMDDGDVARTIAPVLITLNGLRDMISPSSFELLLQKLAFRIADDFERAVVIKKFTQLGALALERDTRDLSSALASKAQRPHAIRALFFRLLQLSALLGVQTLEEVHDVWDSFHSSNNNNNNNNIGLALAPGDVRPKDGLTTKEVKRALGLRIDLVGEVNRLKL